MEVVHISNHVVRKALCLSLNEMAVLCDIIQMSQSAKYNFTCVKSKEKIAEWLDLSRATVYNAINTLEHKGYIVRVNGSGLRPSPMIQEIMQCQEEIGLWIKTNDVTLVTKKMQELGSVQNLDGVHNLELTVQNLENDRLKIRQKPSKIYTKEYNIEYNKDYNKDILSDFEKFWDSYGKKVGKKQSIMQWMKLSDKDRTDALNFVPQYVNFKPELKYRKDPERYLSHRVWEDDLQVLSQNDKKDNDENVGKKYFAGVQIPPL